MANFDYDLLVLGAGPGGYVAAIRATQLGMKAAVIEKDKPGGVCLNIGCIPSKALIHQAELMHCATELEAIGVKVDASGLDYGKVFAFSRKAADMLSRGVAYLLKKNKIDLISGEGVITSAHEIEVKGRGKVTGKNLLIATGSRPRSIPGFDFDEKTVLSSTGALMLEKLPKRVCVLGGGAIGVEFAHIMNAFGVEVHLVEMLDQLLPLEDEEAVDVLLRAFKKRGIKIYTSTKATGYRKSGKGVKISLEGKGENRNSRWTRSCWSWAGCPTRMVSGWRHSASSRSRASSRWATTTGPRWRGSMPSAMWSTHRCWPM